MLYTFIFSFAKITSLSCYPIQLETGGNTLEENLINVLKVFPAVFFFIFSFKNHMENKTVELFILNI